MKYGKSEIDKMYNERTECRQIVSEIMNFGVTESQKIRILYLLALEIENNDLMKKISLLCKEELEKFNIDEDVQKNHIIDI